MTIQQKGLIFIGLFITILLLVFIITTISANRDDELRDRKLNEYVGKVQFKGKVIHSKIYQYSGKDYFMICVQLDYSNFKEYYVLNDYCFFKIKNNIATMAVGVFNPNYGIPKYVEVNIANSGVEKFVYANGTANDFGLSLANWGLTKDDMNVCN
jgi:hypothetical protein